MKKTNKFITIIVCIALTGCSFGGYNPKKDFNLKESDNLQTEEYGIVIMKLGNFETRAMNRKNIIAVKKEKPIAQTKWCNENKECFYTNSRNGNSFALGIMNFFGIALGLFVGKPSIGYYDYYYKTFPEGYVALKIKNGNYYLKSFEWQNGDGLTIPQKTLTFQVLSDQIIYIGDISIKTCNKTFKKQSLYIEVQDSFQEVKMDMMQNFPSIDPAKIEKRLLAISEEVSIDECEIT